MWCRRRPKTTSASSSLLLLLWSRAATCRWACRAGWWRLWHPLPCRRCHPLPWWACQSRAKRAMLSKLPALCRLPPRRHRRMVRAGCSRKRTRQTCRGCACTRGGASSAPSAAAPASVITASAKVLFCSPLPLPPLPPLVRHPLMLASFASHARMLVCLCRACEEARVVETDALESPDAF